jgi:MscS family membrane protein
MTKFKPRFYGIAFPALLAALVFLLGFEAHAATSGSSVAPGRTLLSFGLDRITWLKGEVLGNPVWQYGASLLYVLLAFYVSKLLDYFVHVQLSKWTRRTSSRTNDLFITLLRGPVKIIAFVIFLHVGLRLFAWPEWASYFISNGLKIIVAFSLTYVALKFVDLFMGLWQKRAQQAQEGVLDMQLFPVLSKTLKIFVLIVAALVTTQNLGMNVTGLLASVSIGGLAVGLAAQDTLSNLFGAVAIFADKPFRVGDHIRMDSIDGNVEAIGLRSTRVRNQEGFLVTIPNKNMASANIVNISKRLNIKTVMNLAVTHDCPTDKVERAMQLIDDVYRPHPKTANLLVSFNKFDAAALNIMVIHWWDSTDYDGYLKGIQLLNLELKRRFDDEQIRFASPSQTVYLRQDSRWQVVDSKASPTGDNGENNARAEA